MQTLQTVCENRTRARLAAASPEIVLCDPAANAETAIKTILRAQDAGVDFLALPELFLTGATVGSLMRHEVVLAAAERALKRVVEATKHVDVISTIGLPYMINGRVLSCVALISRGRVYAIVPASCGAEPFGFLPEADYMGSREQALTPIPELTVGFGGELFASAPKTRAFSAMLMPSALNATAKSEKEVLRALKAFSARNGVAVAYAAPGVGESTTAFVFDGVCAIVAGGEVLAYSKPFEKDAFVYADVELAGLAPFEPYEADETGFDEADFLSADPAEANAECERILELQARALVRRLSHINGKGFVIGVSGGLDSAIALMAACRAADIMGLKRSAVQGVSMPGFGTSKLTHSNSRDLIEAMGCGYREISVVEACRRHFIDIGHDESVRDVVFENAQARERTKILLSIANAEGLLDVGTGDLSEAALGFTTFGGDHLAQYGVNASLPKTVLRKVALAAGGLYPEAAKTLKSIVDTPVSPELLPPEETGEIKQRTEEILGSYDLHDFFLFNMLRGDGPEALYIKALERFNGEYSASDVYRTLGTFLRRFFSQQYKRNCAPEAPMVLASVAPTMFTMPSDMVGKVFLREYEKIALR